MWSRANGLSDHELVNFDITEDLVQVSIALFAAPISEMAVCCFIKYEQVRSAATSYGNIILGKIKLPAVNDDEGEGFIHVRFVLPSLSLVGCLAYSRVRIHDPPNRVSSPRKPQPPSSLTLS